jgi:hypothetical protein
VTLAELRALLVPELGEQQTDRVLELMVRLCPGDEVYIPKRARAPEIRPEDTPAAIQRRYNVSRATAYNWVSAYRR